MKDFWILQTIAKRQSRANFTIKDLPAAPVNYFKAKKWITKFGILTAEGLKRYNEQKLKTDHH